MMHHLRAALGLPSALEASPTRVTDGARTHIYQLHKLALYQLSYGHQVLLNRWKTAL